VLSIFRFWDDNPYLEPVSMAELPKVEPYGGAQMTILRINTVPTKTKSNLPQQPFKRKTMPSQLPTTAKIEMSPFEINNYCNRGIAYYK
jgi:hypothetical protein